MGQNSFQVLAADIASKTGGTYSGRDVGKRFASIAAEVREMVAQDVLGAPARDSEWQRVNSYIADVLKDTHVLYSKLARLQGDFIGSELSELESISSKVLDLGEELSKFMKAFHKGEASMMKEKQFGGGEGGGGQGAPPGTPPPSIPSEFKRSDDEFETELDLEGDDDFDGYDGGQQEEQQEQQ